MISNFHTHSRFCDGKGEPREYVEYALSRGFNAIGFSSHAPVPFPNNFSVTDEEYLDYCNEVRRLKAEYEGRIEIHLGLEIDYIPGVLEDFRPLVEKGGLEYVIGSVHLLPHPDNYETLRKGVDDIPPYLWFIDGPKQESYDDGLNRIFHGDIRAGVKAFFHQNNAMIERNCPDIVGHVDKIVMHNHDRYFLPNEPWFRDLLFETLRLISEKGIIAEINTRGIYKGRHYDFYPSRDAIRYMNQLGIPVIVSTDAHQPTDLDKDEGAFEFLKEIKYKNLLHSINHIL